MYKTIRHLSETTDISRQEVKHKIDLMKRSQAYPIETFLTNPIRCDEAAFIHFNTFQQLIMNGKPFPEWSGK